MRETIARRFQFCAGHRVKGHESKCAHLHGHNYVLHAWCRAAHLDGIGRVIDFSEVKARLGSWIDENWDHGFILHRDDAAGIAALDTFQEAMRGDLDGCPTFVQKRYLMQANPTAENMASHILIDVCPRLFKGTTVEVFKVDLWETENCVATVTKAGR